MRAEDDPHDLSKPRGKQDWQLHPHSIWYPRTTGIWQTVWLERVPATCIGSVRWTPNVERWEIGFEARLDGERRDGLRLNVKLCAGDQLLADDTYAVVAGEVHRRIALSDPGIDDYRNELLWSPATPTLIDAELKLWGGRGELVDTAAQLHRAALHRRAGRPVRAQRPALPAAHGARPGLLAGERPDRARRRRLRRDVELAKAMGFNGVRKHQKIENPRYLYWADMLGLLVWEEMPSAYRFTKTSIERLTREWTEVIDARRQPPLHRGLGAVQRILGRAGPARQPRAAPLRAGALPPDQDARPHAPGDRQRRLGERGHRHHRHSRLRRPARAHRASATAPTRVPRLFKRERPGGRLLLLEGQHARAAHHAHRVRRHRLLRRPRQHLGLLALRHARRSSRKQYMHLLRVVRSLPLLAGFCYTQFTDTYQEANGLLYADRHAQDSRSSTSRWPRAGRARSATARSNGTGASAS